MQVTPSSTVVGAFRNQSTADQAAEAFYNAGFECKQMRDIVSNPSSGFFGDLKNFFTGTSANTSHTEDTPSNPLIALGLSREAAHYYSDEYSKGNPVLIIKAQGREQEILAILGHYGAYNAQIQSIDQVQPLTNTSQPNSYKTSTLQSDTQNWEAPSQVQTAQETPFEERPQDTEPFNTLETSSTASPSDNQALYHTPADQSTPVNSWDAEPPLAGSTTASDRAQSDITTPAQEEETPMTQTNANVSENGIEERDMPVAHVEISTPAQEDEGAPVTADSIDTSENVVEELDTPEVQQEDEEALATPDSIDTSENVVEELDTPEIQQAAEEAPVAADSIDTSENVVEELDMPEVPQAAEEASATPDSIDTSENVVEELDAPALQQEDEEPLTVQDNIYASEYTAEELDTPDVEQEDEEAPTTPDSIDTSEHAADEFDTPTAQADRNASDQENESFEEQETPVLQNSVDAYKSDFAENNMSTLQADVYNYQASQAVTDISTQGTDVEASSQNTAAFEDEEELQRLQDQIKFTQQQLESAKTRLDALKERERQYRKRQKQLQNTRKQLQELQAELQATQAELQETETRVTSYQASELENFPRPLEKQKKAKK